MISKVLTVLGRFLDKN